VVPLVKHVIRYSSYKQIAHGNFDDILVKYARKMKNLNAPLFYVPFPEINCNKAWKSIEWGGQSGRDAIKALRHMRHVYDSEGVDNAVWVIQYLTQKCPLWVYPGEFYPGDDIIDWIGFTVRSRQGEYIGPMRHIFDYSYRYSRSNHKNKPIMLVELGALTTSHRPKWITDAYFDIENRYPAVKAVLYSERPVVEIQENSTLGELDKVALQKALSSDYFIEGIPIKR